MKQVLAKYISINTKFHIATLQIQTNALVSCYENYEEVLIYFSS